MMETGMVVSVSASGEHGFSKPVRQWITLLEGLGLEGDAHAGVTVKHRSRVARDPSQPNLRQVHLMAQELLDALGELGHAVRPGELGENITTRGINLLDLPAGTLLRIGEAEIEITGLRNPCAQIEAFRPGLLAQVVEKRPDGSIWRKAGIMGVVRTGGVVRPGDAVAIVLPHGPHVGLEVV